MIISFIGCGLSTTSVLFYLNKKLNNSSSIKKINIIDSCSIDDFGKGIYRNPAKNIFLNTPIYLSTISHENEFSFKNWLENNELINSLDAGNYSPRFYFGLYLNEIFRNIVNDIREKGIEVNLVKGYVHDIIKNSPKIYRIKGYFETDIISHKIILACGTSFKNENLNISRVEKLRNKKILIVGSSLSFLDVFRNISLSKNEVYFCSKSGFFPKIRSENKYDHDFLYKKLLSENTITIKKLNKIVSEYIGVNFFSYLKNNLIYCNNILDLDKNINIEDPIVSIFTNSSDHIQDIWMKFDVSLKKLIMKKHGLFTSYQSPMYKELAKNLFNHLNSKSLKYIDKYVIKSFSIDNKTIIKFNDNSINYFDEVIYCSGFDNKITNDLLFENLLLRGLINKNEMSIGVEVSSNTLKAKESNIYCIGHATFGHFIGVNTMGILNKMAIKISENVLNEISENILNEHC